MRKIKFRGKRVDNGEWVIGWFYWITKGAHLDPIQNGCYIQTFKKLDNGEIILTGCFEVIPETVGQYTGLNDKNGNGIYEGDVLKSPDARACRVCWENIYTCGFQVKGDLFDCPMLMIQSDMYEIIGNVHDNPELLEATI